MTTVETKIYRCLELCKTSDLKDQVFINQLNNKESKTMTAKGHDFMMSLLKKYRTQIPNWLELQAAMIEEEIESLGI